MNRHTKIVLAFATASLGLLVGWLTGMSGLDPGVVAAVVPVVVTASGMAIYYGTRTEPDPVPQVMAGYAILLFCLTIMLGIAGASLLRNESAEDAVSGRARYLAECSLEEYNINTGRKELGLPRLPSNYFCKR